MTEEKVGKERRRPWYQKKTTWAIVTVAISGGLKLNPATAFLSEWVLIVGNAFGLYAVQDRVNKINRNNKEVIK